MGISSIAPNVATALCFGKHAPFTTINEVPADILAEAEAGAAEALAVGIHVPSDGATLGRAVGMTVELREQLKCWLIWPAGATYDDLAARRLARAAERRAKDQIRKQQQRRARGMVERKDYEENSIAAQARALGIKPNTLRARLRRAAAASAVTLDVPSVSAQNINRICAADTHGTKRDTLAEQARAMGISPATLRKRLQRERQHQQQAMPVTHGTVTPAAAGAPLKARHADIIADNSDICGRPVFDDCPPMGEAPEPIPIVLDDLLGGPGSYDQCIPFTPPADESPAPSPGISAHPAVIQDEFADGEPMPPPRAARPRPALPEQSHLPASIPGRNLIYAIGAELAHLVHARAHEALTRMLAVCDPSADAQTNRARMAIVWEGEFRRLRRELLRRGAQFLQLIYAMHGMRAITAREIADAERYRPPMPMPPEPAAGLAA